VPHSFFPNRAESLLLPAFTTFYSPCVYKQLGGRVFKVFTARFPDLVRLGVRGQLSRFFPLVDFPFIVRTLSLGRNTLCFGRPLLQSGLTLPPPLHPSSFCKCKFLSNLVQMLPSLTVFFFGSSSVANSDFFLPAADPLLLWMRSASQAFCCLLFCPLRVCSLSLLFS